jgi:hypothetical protein
MLRLVWIVQIPALTPLGDWQAAIDAQTGEVLSYRNLMTFDSGMVFNPNPYESSGHTIPPPTNCDTAPNATALAAQRTSKTLLGITAAQNKLKGQYVDLTAPGITGAYKTAGQANEATRTYNYGCNDDRFEEVMTYYWVDTTQRKIQSLGFTGTSAILNSPIPAHAHYNTGCNAVYSPEDKGLHFFDGDGVNCFADTAEDADVIVHEYGHAIQGNQIPGYGFGNAVAVEQALAMGEGFGDFLTAAMFGDACIGGWALNEVYDPGADCLRDDQNTNVYPADYNACPLVPPSNYHEEHCGGLLWGGALFDLIEALGNNQAARDTALKLVLDSHFYLGTQPTFNDGAAAIKQADADLYGGAHAATIDSVFAARGILTANPIPDAAYVFMRFRHPFVSDLGVRVKVGTAAAPDCDVLAFSNLSDVTFSPDVAFLFPLSAFPACFQSHFPPTAVKPWRLEATDDFPGGVGTIDAFEIGLSGSRRCVAIDTPITIPDGITPGVPGTAVNSKNDCSTQIGALPTVAPSTATNTATPTRTNTPTNTPTRTNTPTSTPTRTNTPTNTPTFTNTPTPTLTATNTPTVTPTVLPGDSDGDGIVNAVDNCIDIANADQLNSDKNLVDLPATKAFDDTSRAYSDNLGDACDADDDNDGLADSVEVQIGPAGAQHATCAAASAASNPLVADTDDDGTVDSAECLLGTDPANAASKPATVVLPDADNDGAPDSLDPNDANTDSDGDGVLDGIEFRGYNTSMVNADSDGDGCSDGKEVASVDGLASVNSIDLQQVAQSFSATQSAPNYLLDFDVTKNGQVNSLDLQLVARQFGAC